MSAAQKRTTGEETIATMFEPDTILPTQFSDRNTLEPSAYPEKRLMLAVLEDAVATYQRCAGSRDRRGQRLFHEAEEWIATGESDWPFAFENICHALEIEPEFLRRGLAAWKERHLNRPAGARVYRFPFRRVNGRRHSISARPEGLRQIA